MKVKKNKIKSYKKIIKRKRIHKKVRYSLKKRQYAELRLKIYGIIAICLSVLTLFIMLSQIFSKGYTAFIRTEINLKINFDKEKTDNNNYRLMIIEALQEIFPEVTEEREIRDLSFLISRGAAGQLRKIVSNNPSVIGTEQKIWLIASSKTDMIVKGHIESDKKDISFNNMSIANSKRIKLLQSKNLVRKRFNSTFFLSGDSREPELAGVLSAFTGSVMMIFICVAFALPLGVLTALYLEEFAPSNKLTDFIEININNLTAVPSIVYGLLGFTIYLQFFSFPRSSPVAGGLTLAMMLLPVIVVTSGTAIRSVPEHIKEGAYALGATKIQVIMHHIIPFSVPGIMTGTILGISRILGETAPLLMIGMIAFIVDVPESFTDSATALPAQIYLWSDSPEAGFIEKTSAAIIVLLVFLFIVNFLSVLLRKKFKVNR